MMNNMTGGGMMGGWFMGGFGVLITVLPILAVAALVKYLFFTRRRED
ncbi:MAG: hypothetical protein O2967_06240 [Proteobacteria bacterium]|nr:hypothetical protein [Pseudomonadota bacterium]